MKIQITKTIGKATLNVEVDADKDIDALVKASTITTIPDSCGLCKSSEVELTANKADAYTFIKVKCLKCSATSTMGQYKDGTGGFWKEFEIFKKDAGSIDKVYPA